MGPGFRRGDYPSRVIPAEAGTHELGFWGSRRRPRLFLNPRCSWAPAFAGVTIPRVIPAEAGTHDLGFWGLAGAPSPLPPPSVFVGPGFRRGDCTESSRRRPGPMNSAFGGSRRRPRL